MPPTIGKQNVKIKLQPWLELFTCGAGVFGPSDAVVIP